MAIDLNDINNSFKKELKSKEEKLKDKKQTINTLNLPKDLSNKIEENEKHKIYTGESINTTLLKNKK